ncbi:uncharacterized protein LOC110061282 isoform X2 [Orbicella faveolata]|uniref:uncharacterized protein LOC110061282 isoform X2 n=1 Tax=Orbicella faveolata TaxID=48498 RepID=UPI0009E429A9|nr:uncharacterized protein LOC110061282 isoform X2 [Orbicella faveolata]
MVERKLCCVYSDDYVKTCKWRLANSCEGRGARRSSSVFVSPIFLWLLSAFIRTEKAAPDYVVGMEIKENLGSATVSVITRLDL